jgi:hypothetical protein
MKFLLIFSLLLDSPLWIGREGSPTKIHPNLLIQKHLEWTLYFGSRFQSGVGASSRLRTKKSIRRRSP